eukprot:jgi/Mesvir1/3326/Mv21218-RA.1
MISRHLQQYVDNNCVGGAQMDVLLEDGVDGAKRAVIRLSEMDDDKEDVNIRLKRHDDNTADCVFGSRGVADERQVFHDAAEKVVEWMMGWSNLDVRIFNRLTSDFLLRGSFKMVDRARQSRNQMEKGGPTSQVVGDSPPRGEGSEGQPVQAQGASPQQPPHKRAREGTPPPMVESGVSFAAVTGKDEYHGGLEMVDDPVKRIQIERFERLANGTREQQFALYQDILNDKPEVAKVPYTSKRTFMPRFETLLQQELRLRRLAQNAPETVAAAPSHAAPAAVAQKRGESVHESAAVPSTARDPPATSKPVATGDMPPPRQRGRGKGVDGGEVLDVFDMTLGNLEGGGPIFEAGRQGGANLQGEGAIAVGEPVSEGAGGSDGDTAKMTRFKEQADAYQLKKLAKWVVAEVRTETAPPEVRNQMMTLHQVAELIVKNACAPDGATQPEEIPSAKALIKWMEENLFEGKGKERKCKLKTYVQAERATHAAILYSISLDQHARRENMKIDSTWTAAVDEHQKGLSEALATYKGKALKGKGKGKEVEVADAPVSLLEKWEKSPVSQDDDDILDVNDEIAKGKRLRKQLAVQPRDLDEMSKALVHRNRVWTRNLFVGPQKLLARDLHLSRAEQNATIFANSESDYGHDKLVIPVWRTGRFLDDLKPVDVRKAALLDSLCKSAWEMAPLEKKPPLPPAICGFLVLDGNHFTTLIKSVKFELVTDNMTVDQRSVWYQAMLNGFMKAEKLRVVARGGKEQEVTKTVAAAKLEEWATDWTNFGGWTCRCSRVTEQVGKMIEVVRQLGNAMNAEDTAQAKATWGSALGDVHRAYQAYGPVKRGKGVSLPTPLYGKIWAIVKPFWQKGEQAKAEGDGAGDKAGGAEETDKWGPDQKNFMQRWLFWCEDPLKPAVDGKPAIAQDIAARQDFLDTRPKDKAHELSIFTAHRELASFQYFDSLIQAPIMSCEAPPSNLIKIMEVAKNLIEAAKQFAHIKFLENPELMAACKQLNGTFDPVLVREHVFGVKLKGTFATDLDKFIADCRLTRDFWRVVVTAMRAIILTLRDLPPAKRKVVDQKDWKFPRGLLASHPRHLYDDLGVKTKHLLGVPQEAAAEVEKEVEEAAEEGTAKAKKGWKERLEAYSDWKGVRMGSDWIAYRTMTWKENEKRKDLVVTKVVDELCAGNYKIPRSLEDQAFAVLDLAADSNEKWRNLRKWDADCIPEESNIPKPSSHLSPVVWDVVDKMTNALFRGPCRVLLVFGEPAHIRRKDGCDDFAPRSTGMEQCPNTILLNEDDDPEPSADTDFVASTPLQKRVLEARNVEGPPKVSGGGPAFAGLMRPTEVVDVEAPPGTSTAPLTFTDIFDRPRMPFHAPTGKAKKKLQFGFPVDPRLGLCPERPAVLLARPRSANQLHNRGGRGRAPTQRTSSRTSLTVRSARKNVRRVDGRGGGCAGAEGKTSGRGQARGGQETEGADEPAQPQKGGGQGRDATAENRIRDVRPDVRMRFMDGAKLSRGGWSSKWVDDVCINWQHKYPKKEDFPLFGTLLGKEREKVVFRWFDEGHDLGWSNECEQKFRFPLKFAREHVTLLKEGASWDNIPSYRPGKR